MTEESVTDKDKLLADGIRDLLIERIKDKSINASEMKAAIELLEKRGYKWIEPGTRVKGLKRPLPSFDDEGKVLQFG